MCTYIKFYTVKCNATFGVRAPTSTIKCCEVRLNHPLPLCGGGKGKGLSRGFKRQPSEKKTHYQPNHRVWHANKITNVDQSKLQYTTRVYRFFKPGNVNSVNVSWDGARKILNWSVNCVAYVSGSWRRFNVTLTLHKIKKQLQKQLFGVVSVCVYKSDLSYGAVTIGNVNPCS